MGREGSRKNKVQERGECKDGGDSGEDSGRRGIQARVKCHTVDLTTEPDM